MASSLPVAGPSWAWLVAGVLGVIGGVAALLDPVTATLTAEQIAGWVFLLMGVVHGIDSFRAQGWGGRLWALLLAAVFILFALALLAQPLRGVLALTLVAAVLLLGSGVSKIGLSFRLGRSVAFWTMLLSGILSAVLGAMVLINFPWSAAATLGIFLAVELLSSGLALIVMWQAVRRRVVMAG